MNHGDSHVTQNKNPDLTLDDVKHVAALARIQVAESELETIRTQLSDVLEIFAALQDVDTTNVEPTGHVNSVNSVMREDEPSPSLTQEQVLANAPQEYESFFRIKPVLD